MNPRKLNVDIAILGGGIAGLWLLTRLRQQGYQAVLLETAALGQGQTLSAQGIIHGGTKYAVARALTGIAASIKQMPRRWRDCLAGRGEIDLQAVQLLSPHQYLWVPASLRGKFVGFLTSKLMQSRVEKLKSAEFPQVFQHEDFRGEVYRLDEPVLHVKSLLTALRLLNLPFLGKLSGAEQLHWEGGHLKDTGQQLIINAQRFILTAGAGNAALNSSAQMQSRPLKMLMLKNMPLPLYAHCVDSQFKPHLSITSHFDPAGKIIWYLGGEVAESGVEQTDAEVYAYGRHLIHELLPWLDLTSIQWQTHAIARSEAWQMSGKIPAGPYVSENGHLITAWPTKLAYAPLLADQVLRLIKKTNILPNRDYPLHDYFQVPKVGVLPWEDVAWES